MASQFTFATIVCDVIKPSKIHHEPLDNGRGENEWGYVLEQSQKYTFGITFDWRRVCAKNFFSNDAIASISGHYWINAIRLHHNTIFYYHYLGNAPDWVKRNAAINTKIWATSRTFRTRGERTLKGDRLWPVKIWYFNYDDEATSTATTTKREKYRCRVSLDA